MRNTKKVIAATAAVATLVGLAACGSSNDNGANKGDADKAELVFWGWDSGNSMKEILADFEKANPGITVKFNNTGTAEKTSTALSNAIAAGNGAPDVVMLEDPTVTQFAVTDGLVDLSEFGADKLADDFAAGPWNKLQYNNKPYALPIDSGPEMFFYNKAVFDKAGVDGESIKTWERLLRGRQEDPCHRLLHHQSGRYLQRLSAVHRPDLAGRCPAVEGRWREHHHQHDQGRGHAALYPIRPEAHRRRPRGRQDPELVRRLEPRAQRWHPRLPDHRRLDADQPHDRRPRSGRATGASPSCRSGRKARKSPPKTVALHLPSPRSPRTRPLPTSSLST